MENKVKKSSLTKADWISLIVWLVIFCPLTFLGFSLEFNWGMSFLFTAICFCIGWWGFVKSLKYFKKAEDNIRQSRIVETILFVVAAAIVLFLFDRPMVRILTVAVVDKSELQDKAIADVERLDSLFAAYEVEEEEAINSTRDILKSHSNYPVIDSWVKSMFGEDCSYRRLPDSEISNYIAHRWQDVLSKTGPGSTPTPTGVDGDYMTFKQDQLRKITKLESAAYKFNLITVPSLGMRDGYLSIAGTGNEIVAFLEAKRTKTNIDNLPYLFEISSSGNMEVSPRQAYSYHSDFKESLDAIAEISFDKLSIWISYLIVVVINALMFFSYFISYRSSKVEVTRRSNKGTPLGGAVLD